MPAYESSKLLERERFQCLIREAIINIDRCAGDLRKNERPEVHDALSLLMMLGIPLVIATRVAPLMASLTIA